MVVTHICAVCDLPVEDDDAHFPHDDGCPNSDGQSSCYCANVTHSGCCWTCNEESHQP